MKIELSEFDASEYLDTDEVRSAYLSEALESNDADEFMSALSDVAKAIGMNRIAQISGIGRERLYKTLSSKKPCFYTMIKIIHSLNMEIQLISNKRTDKKAASC